MERRCRRSHTSYLAGSCLTNHSYYTEHSHKPGSLPLTGPCVTSGRDIVGTPPASMSAAGVMPSWCSSWCGVGSSGRASSMMSQNMFAERALSARTCQIRVHAGGRVGAGGGGWGALRHRHMRHQVRQPSDESGAAAVGRVRVSVLCACTTGLGEEKHSGIICEA